MALFIVFSRNPPDFNLILVYAHEHELFHEFDAKTLLNCHKPEATVNQTPVTSKIAIPELKTSFESSENTRRFEEVTRIPTSSSSCKMSSQARNGPRRFGRPTQRFMQRKWKEMPRNKISRVRGVDWVRFRVKRLSRWSSTMDDRAQARQGHAPLPTIKRQMAEFWRLLVALRCSQIESHSSILPEQQIQLGTFVSPG
ncbi:Knot1 domain-containing protein [Psidium guajava]|nr:Knot1 domain-containing protein [Psidium guajava]